MRTEDTSISLLDPSRTRALARLIFFAMLVLIGTAVISQPTYAQTQTGDTDVTGFLEICKEADPASSSPVSGSFTFLVGGQAVTVPVGQCSLPIRVTTGNVSITETARSGFEVSDIRTDIADRLVSRDLDNRTAVVRVVQGDQSTQTIVRFRNRAVPTGFLEICKEADPSAGPVTGSFTFTVAGTTVMVPVGQCSQPIQLPAGPVTITEAPRAGFQLVNVRTDPDRLISADLENRTATVQIVGGNISTQTIVRFRNRAVPPGQLKICKLAGAGVNTGDLFTFTAGGNTVNVSAGSCSTPLQFPQGTEVTVTETNIPSNLQVGMITVAPMSRLVPGSANLSAGRVRVIIGEGVTEVFFTNQESQRGQLKICKVGGSGVTGNFTFTLSGVNSPVTVTAGNCSLPILLPVGMQVTVTETNIPSTIRLVSITSAPIGRVSPDLNNNRGVVTIGTGVTEVTFRNELRAPACAPRTCLYTLGGYRNKPERFPSAIQSGGLQVGGRTLTRDQLVTVLNMNPGQNGNPNFAIQVARQLITALANVGRIQAAGGCVPQDVQVAIAAAQQLLSNDGSCIKVVSGRVTFACTRTPSSTVIVNGRTFTASELVNILTAFNESSRCD